MKAPRDEKMAQITLIQTMVNHGLASSMVIVVLRNKGKTATTR
jgi:hypothetical protein